MNCRMNELNKLNELNHRMNCFSKHLSVNVYTSQRKSDVLQTSVAARVLNYVKAFQNLIPQYFHCNFRETVRTKGELTLRKISKKTSHRIIDSVLIHENTGNILSSIN